MPSPADLDARAVDLPAKQLHSAEVVDSAIGTGDLVRCAIPEVDPLLATIRLAWDPVVRPTGFFFPKRKDKALVAIPGDGPPWIVRWTPSATAPDVPLP
jgi:hypothetical protein